MRNLIKKIAFPFLNRWYQAKTKSKSSYTKHGLTLQIFPSVFHPGIFLSTNILIDFLSGRDVKNVKILELGAGSGMISFFLAKNGAIVTATDINKNAIQGLKENVKTTGIQIDVIESNLFENIPSSDFELIIINPPYYPKNPTNEKDIAFYCGDDFQYFEELLPQLKERIGNEIIMILSEDCELEKIKKIAERSRIKLELIHKVKKRGEENVIFTLLPIKE